VPEMMCEYANIYHSFKLESAISILKLNPGRPFLGLGGSATFTSSYF
jgi:hypothetical protein